MTVMTNLRGTTEDHFRISNSGPTIYTGSDDPNSTNPSYIDNAKEGDLYIRTSSGNEALWIYQTDTWYETPTPLNGGTFMGQVSMQSVSFPNAINASNAILIGGDVNLFRNAANVLRTDDSLNIGGTATINGEIFLSGNLIIQNNNSIIKLPNGDAVNPSIVFNELTTGIYSPNSHIIGFSTETQPRLTIDSISISPATNNSYNLGTSTNKFSTAYINSIMSTGASTFGDLTVTGTFINTGTTTEIDQTVTGNIITLNNGETGNGITMGSSGIEIERGTETNVSLLYLESTHSDNPTDNGLWYLDGPEETRNMLVENLTVMGSLSVDGSTNFLDNMNINVPDGSITAPSISFTNDTDTGIFKPMDGNIGFTVSGQSRITMSELGIIPETNIYNLGSSTNKFQHVYISDTVDTRKLYVSIGSESSPSITFANDTDTGIYHTGTALGFTVGGVRHGTFYNRRFITENGTGHWFRASNQWGGEPLPFQGKIEYYNNDSNNDGTGEQLGNAFYINAGSASTNIAIFRVGPTNVARIDATGEYTGTATTARYADLAERYYAGCFLEIGTVVLIDTDGEFEIKKSNQSACNRVIGVVSEKPAFKMNSEAGTDKTHPYIALRGKTKILVDENVKTGDLLVSSKHGRAKTAKWYHKLFYSNSIFAKSLTDSHGTGEVKGIIL